MNRRDIFRGLAAIATALYVPFKSREQRIIDLLQERIANAKEQIRIDLARNAWWNTTTPVTVDKDALEAAWNEAATDYEWKEYGETIVWTEESI